MTVPEKCEPKICFEMEEASRPAGKESRPTPQGRKKIKHHIVSVKLSGKICNHSVKSELI